MFVLGPKVKFLFSPNSVEVTHVTGCHALRPPPLPVTEYKHLAFNAAWMAL